MADTSNTEDAPTEPQGKHIVYCGGEHLTPPSLTHNDPTIANPTNFSLLVHADEKGSNI